jgi:hypothetical protein
MEGTTLELLPVLILLSVLPSAFVSTLVMLHRGQTCASMFFGLLAIWAICCIAYSVFLGLLLAVFAFGLPAWFTILQEHILIVFYVVQSVPIWAGFWVFQHHNGGLGSFRYGIVALLILGEIAVLTSAFDLLHPYAGLFFRLLLYIAAATVIRVTRASSSIATPV